MADTQTTSPAYNPEENTDSIDSLDQSLHQTEKELHMQQQEQELQQVLKMDEEKLQKDATAEALKEMDELGTAATAAADAEVPQPVAAPVENAWQQGNSTVEDMAVDEEPTTNGAVTPDTNGIKREGEDQPTEDEPSPKQQKLDEFTKLFTTAEGSPRDFSAWTTLLAYVDQQNELEPGRQAYNAFFSRYPYCYGYWKKFSELEKRKGDRESVLNVFEKGVDSIPLSVDLWVHYMDYVVDTFRAEEEEDYVRMAFDRAVRACGMDYKSEKIWEAYLSWERAGERWVRVTGVYDRLLATPNHKYQDQWTKFTEHVRTRSAHEVVAVEEFLALRARVRGEEVREAGDEAPPGVEAEGGEAQPTAADEEEDKLIQQLILNSREEVYQKTSDDVKTRYAYEQGIKRPYFHVKPLENMQIQSWRDYLDFEIKQGDEVRTRTLFERCLIAAALYEEFWLRYIHYLETIPSATEAEIRSVYVRACTIHVRDRMKLQLSWALFEEEHGHSDRALDILKEAQTRETKALEPRVQAAAVLRRRGDLAGAQAGILESVSEFKDEEKLSREYCNLVVRYAQFMAMFMNDNQKAVSYLEDVVEECCKEERKLSEDEQSCAESLLWALFDRAMSCSPPKFNIAAAALKRGTTEHFGTHCRLQFANRYSRFVAECGPEGVTVSSANRLLRDLRQELKPTDEEKSGEGDGSSKKGSGSGSNKNGDKQSSTGAPTANGGNAQYPSGQNAYGAGQYPAQTGQTPVMSAPPPQGPPPQTPQQGYGQGYNQNYGGGQYPPQGQYGGQWGYPPQQQQGYGYNQQNWGSGYNYYGQR